jgi:hypothetical protein
LTAKEDMQIMATAVRIVLLNISNDIGVIKWVVIEVLFNRDLRLNNLLPMVREKVPAPTPWDKKSKHKLPTHIV